MYRQCPRRRPSWVSSQFRAFAKRESPPECASRFLVVAQSVSLRLSCPRLPVVTLCSSAAVLGGSLLQSVAVIHEAISITENESCVQSLNADVVIDSSGNPDALNDCITAVADGGTIIALGSNRQATRELSLPQLGQERSSRSGRAYRYRSSMRRVYRLLDQTTRMRDISHISVSRTSICRYDGH